MNVQPMPHVPHWPNPDPRFLRADLPEPQGLPLDVVVCPRLAEWARKAAQAKGAPADYVFSALLSIAASLIGNARWVSPWKGWHEPPLIWCMNIGLPSAGKSPGIDAMMDPLRKAEARLRQDAKAVRDAWSKKQEIAEIVERHWKAQVKKAIEEGQAPPPKPKEAMIESEPHWPRLVVNDSTIERLGVILTKQPGGLLYFRDELSGWLEGMVRYSAASDRAFWIEAYGGRGYSVERMSREPLTINRLSIGILGGIQPDRLRTLFFKADDDGLLARMLPVWPHPIAVSRPRTWAEDGLIEAVIAKLQSLRMVEDEEGNLRPWFVPFSEPARELMDDFRRAVREWERESEGLLLSFIGKLPGLAARLSLVLALLDWAATDGEEPREISEVQFAQAAELIEEYFLPMARRAYAFASVPKVERSARHLIAIIKEKGWRQFASREVARMGRPGLANAAELNPVLEVLVEGDCIKPIEGTVNANGGRPERRFLVNPAILEN